MLSSGVLIDGRYRLEDRLATGGMGDVWRATDVSLGRPVAVKVLLPALLTDPSFGSRFRSEARMLAALHHPGVVRVYDYGESTAPGGGPIAYLVMECVEGEPLSQLLLDGGRLPPADTMAIVAQAAQALHAAHSAGIVHRDVKPSNLLLKPDGTVILVDFGVARSAAATTSITSTNAIVGTAMYMAPEQASGRRISPATDIYALGALAYHCLAGHAPFVGGSPLEVALRHVTDDPPALPADVPPPVRELVGRALAKDPADRFPDAAAFAAAARTVATEPALAGTASAGAGGAAAMTVALLNGGPGVGTRPAIPHQRSAVTAPVVARPDRRGASKRAIAAALLAMVLVIAGITTLLMLSNRDDNQPPGAVPPASESSTPDRGRSSEPGQPGGGGTPTTRRSPTPRPSNSAATGETPANPPAPTRGSSAPEDEEEEQQQPTTPAAGPTTTAEAEASPTQATSSGAEAPPTTPAAGGPQ